MAHDPLAMRHHDSHAASAHSIFHELNGSSDNLAVRAPASLPCALLISPVAFVLSAGSADGQLEPPAVATVRLIALRAVQDEIALLRARLAEAEMSREEVVACRAVPGHAVPSHSCQPCCDVEPSMRGCLGTWAHALQEMEAVYRSVKKIAEEDEGGGLPGFARTVWPASALAHCVVDLVLRGRLSAATGTAAAAPGAQVLKAQPAGRCR